ncbi:MAG: hypothetical protein GQ554_09280 [Deltaproteobacteria bacterium]|nr:hypothetical protein [Deltaproteobacteria bacterium]
MPSWHLKDGAWRTHFHHFRRPQEIASSSTKNKLPAMTRGVHFLLTVTIIPEFAVAIYCSLPGP